jgi:acyl-ACP thioesterase
VTGRVFRAEQPIRLADTAADGRLRLDAVVRYLQDVAADDVLDAGWRPDEHIWIVRRIALAVETPFMRDERVRLATWCSGTAASAATRSTSLAGDAGGRIDTETVWIHLGPDLRPARLDARFLEVYGESAAGRRASTRLELGDDLPDGHSRPWPLRVADVDRLGHVNNAAYWQAVEELLAPDAGRARRVVLEYRQPIDLADEVALHGDARDAAFAVGGEVRARLRASFD